MPNASTHAPGEFVKFSISLPAELESFVATRSSLSKYAGHFSAYMRDLVSSDQDKPAKLPLPVRDFAPGVFRTSISLPAELESFVIERAALYDGSNTSGYLRDLVLLDHARFVKLPPKQRHAWKSPARKVRP